MKRVQTFENNYTFLKTNSVNFNTLMAILYKFCSTVPYL